MKTIIVVDDSSIVVNVVKKAFDGEYNILIAKNGAEAINLIRDNNLDEIVGMLLDLNMPDVNGFTVLDYLKYNNLFKKVPVSIITGDDASDVVSKAFEYPIIDMLKKPFSVDDVKKIANKMINFSLMENV